MRMKITLDSHEVQNVLLRHIGEKFKSLAGRGEYVCAQRYGEPPAAFEALVEAKPEPTDARD